MSNKRQLVPVIGLGLIALVLVACGSQTTPTPAPPTPTVLPATPTPIPPTPTPTPISLSSLVGEGYAAMARSDFAGAIELFEQAAAADPTYAPAVIGLATADYWRLGNEPRSLEFAKKAVELAPESAEAYVALSRAQRSMRNTSAAVQAAEKAAELDATSAEVQAVLADAYLSDRQYEAALKAAERAIELQPDLAVAYGTLASYYWSKGEAGRSQAAYERAISLQPDFAPWHIALGDMLAEGGRYEPAQAEFDKALELMPDSADALLSLAYLTAERGDYDAATAHIDEATSLIPDAPQPYIARSRLYQVQREPDDARVQLRKALDKRENYPAAVEMIGWTYLNEGECDLAVRQFQTLMAEQPRSADGLVGMGFARLCDGDPVKALEYLRKAVKLDPYDEWAYIGLGAAYQAQERWDEADLAFAQALQVGLADAEPHRDLGSALFQQGGTEAAQAEFDLALRLNPEGIENASTHAKIGYLAMIDGKLDAAETHARQALGLDPNDTTAQLVLGMALVRQGKTGEAIDVLESLVDEEPENGPAQAFLGLAYKGEGRFDEAGEALETYVSLQPSGEDDTRTAELIETLRQGYTLTEAKALADLTDQVKENREREATAQIIEIDDVGRTLVVTLTAISDQEPSDVFTDMATTAAIGSNYLPRIEPAVEGGTVVRLVDEGKVLFTMAADHQTATEFADTILEATEFVDALEFKRTTPNTAQDTADEIKANVSSTRELSPTADVPFRVLTEDDVRARFESELDDENRADLRESQALLALLGVIDPGIDLEKLFIDLNAEQIGGFYDLEEQAFYLVDRGESTASDQMTVAHEYVHALQDQHYDLSALKESGANSDEKAAIRALVEGDATLAMLLYGDEHVILYDMMQSISEAGGMESTILDTSPAFIRENEVFPYLQGLDFVETLYDRGAWEAVDEAYQALPRSSEQILHPERYRQGDDPVEVTIPDLAGSLGGQWQEVDRDVMGELGLRLYLQEHVGPTMAAMAAEGWAGDSYVLLRNGEQGPYLLVMQTQWDNQNEADQFWALYQVAVSHRSDTMQEVTSLVGEPDGLWWHSDTAATFARQDGERVLLIIGPDAQTIEAALAGLK